MIHVTGIPILLISRQQGLRRAWLGLCPNPTFAFLFSKSRHIFSFCPRPKSTSPAEQFKPQTLKKSLNPCSSYQRSAFSHLQRTLASLWAVPCAGIIGIGTQTTQKSGSPPSQWHMVLFSSSMAGWLSPQTVPAPSACRQLSAKQNASSATRLAVPKPTQNPFLLEKKKKGKLSMKPAAAISSPR